MHKNDNPVSRPSGRLEPRRATGARLNSNARKAGVRSASRLPFAFLGLIVLGLGLLVAGPFVRAQTDVGAQTNGSAHADQDRSAYVLEANGPIGPAIADYIVNGIQDANDRKADLIVLEMDTPGGLDTSMRRIIKAILASGTPVASFVTPSGARAASAGTYIMYASHIAAMAPGTNLGAATPVQMGGGSPLPTDRDPTNPAEEEKPSPEGTDSEPAQSPDAESGGGNDTTQAGEEDSPALSNEDSMRAKVVNDATAYIKGLAELRGRNVEWAVKAVREAESLTATEAAEINVIDFVAADIAEVIEKSDGRTVDVQGTPVSIASSGASVDRHSPNWSTRLLAAVTHPNVAFLLMTIGFYGLFFELANPGSIFPGTFGLIALILGLYALSVLPVNMAGAALFGLGLILLVAEAFATSGGIFGVAGLIAFAVGATMLFDTDVPGFQLSWQVILGATVVTGAFVVFVIMFALGAQTRRVTTGTEYLVRQKGHVESWDGNEGWVIVEGERWRATCKVPLEAGQQVRVTELNGLMLTVVPV